VDGDLCFEFFGIRDEFVGLTLLLPAELVDEKRRLRRTYFFNMEIRDFRPRYHVVHTLDTSDRTSLWVFFSFALMH
jgi:hypothetical protein